MINEIKSTENKIYKQAKKLSQRSERYKTGLFIAEGRRIVEDAVLSKSVNMLFVSSNYNYPVPDDITTYKITDKMFSALSDTCNSQGIIAVCKMPEFNIKDVKGDTLLVCDGVSDPGNMGTLIRTAECSGASGVVVLKGATDPFSPKVVRSTMGSIFRVPVYFAEATDIPKYLKDYNIVVTVLDGSTDLYQTKLSGKIAVVVGNEGDGISQEVIKQSNVRVRIPMEGSAESLNASVAGSLVLYEIYRQKNL